jgi:drug/metabolite transporter (DMT)-like permease
VAAVGFALAASLSWGVADFVSGVKARSLGTLRFLVPAQLVGVVLAAAIVAARGEGWPGARILLAVPAAVGSTLGLIAFLRAMSIGTLSVVAPIGGASAVVPVVVGLAAGDALGPVRLGGIGGAIAGVMLVSYRRGEGGFQAARGTGLAVLAALLFGLYFPAMHSAATLDAYWALLVFRLASSALAGGIALAVSPGVPAARDLPLVAVAGLLDVGGNLLYALASAAHGLLSVVSVLSTVYPVVTIALATSLLRERPTRGQWFGVALTITAVAVLTASGAGA